VSGRIRMTALLVVAALAVVGGALALIWSLMQPVTLGFFAYAPESGGIHSPGAHILATGTLVAAGVLALGLVALAFWAGIRVGGRRDRRDPGAS
jgi:hypothetical protein